MLCMPQYDIWILLTFFKFYRIQTNKRVIKTEIKESWNRDVLNMIGARTIVSVIFCVSKISIYQISDSFFKLRSTNTWTKKFFDVNVISWHHVIMELLNILFMVGIYFHSSAIVNEASPFIFQVLNRFLIFHRRLTTIRSCKFALFTINPDHFS